MSEEIKNIELTDEEYIKKLESAIADLNNYCDKLKQTLNEIREILEKHKDLGVAENLDYYAIRQDILQIIDKVLGEK